jgi:hypothetical protein
MCVTDGWPTVGKMSSYLLEANAVTGPWRLVTYMKAFGEQGYFLNFPSKFISADGRTLWLCYSGNFSQGWNNIHFKSLPKGSRYGLVLQEVKLLTPQQVRQYKPTSEKRQDDPLRSEKNVARKAKVTASSVYEGYTAEAAIDGIIDGYPQDITAEWAAREETTGAMIRLRWDRPQTVGRIWLFDRPNTTVDQVTAGLLVFSDGTTLPVGPLPDDATAAREVTFPAKTIDWLTFIVTKVKPKTQNAGLSELAVFTD